MEAIVKFYSPVKKFGYAAGPDGDLYLGADCAELDLWPNDLILAHQGKGDRAVDVLLVERAYRRHGFVRFWETDHGYIRCIPEGSAYVNQRILAENGLRELEVGAHVEFCLDETSGLSVYRIALI